MLAQEAGASVDDDLAKAEASRKIDELQEKTGRGAHGRGKSRSSGGRSQGAAR
jgi:hypothetical protein